MIRHFNTSIYLVDVVERYLIFEKFQKIKFCNFDKKSLILCYIPPCLYNERA